MRLNKEIQGIKNVKKIYTKNKLLKDENQTTKKTYENIYLQNKTKKLNNDLANESKKVKNNLQPTPINPKIYKPNKKIRNKLLEKSNTPENKMEKLNNKPFTIKTNNNINIGNNINIINNNISNNSNNGKINNIIFKNNMKTDSQIIRDYNVENSQNNEDIIKNNMNTNNSVNIRKNRILDDMGDYKRKYKGKNTSMDQRHRKLTKDIILHDNEIIKDENSESRKNVYTRPYKTNFSPFVDYNNEYKHPTNMGLLNENENKLFSNNYYFNKYINDNNLANINTKKKMLYNYYYNNDNNYINSLNNNDYNNKYSTNYSFVNNRTQNNTTTNFYKHRSPLNPRQVLGNKYNYFNYINNDRRDIIDERIKGGLYNSMIMDDYKISPFENNDYKNSTLMPNTSRRSKNKLRITKSNNPRIIEYNLDLSDEESEDEKYHNYYKEHHFDKNHRTNYNTSNILNEYSNAISRKKDLQKYYSYYTKDIKPIINNQFNIYGNINKSNISVDHKNIIDNNSFGKRNKEIDYETKDNLKDNHLMKTPDFRDRDRDKTPKIASLIASQRKTYNVNYKNDNLGIEEDDSSAKIVFNKKPIYEMPLTSRERKKNSFFNDNNIGDTNNNKICPNESIKYSPIKPIQKGKNDKIAFNNEDELVEYMKKK